MKTSITSASVAESRIVIAMVGLPARGKSLIAQKIVRYLMWLSINAKCFNVGEYRRQTHCQPSAEFFDPNNEEGENSRRLVAELALEDMIKWFDECEGVVGILDATNSTKSRRRWIKDRCDAANLPIMFVESVCDEQEVILHNIMDVKLSSPDYANVDPDVAVQDFQDRISHYESIYETLDEPDLTYVKLVDVGSQVIINCIRDYLQSRIVYYLMNLHIRPRSIWLSRHGESEFNLSGKIGGDSNLSYRGKEYARRLPSLLIESDAGLKSLTVWTSTLRRTIQTAHYLSYGKLQWKALDELDAGMCDGMTYAEIEEKFPEDFAARDNDKYYYRYRGGESYADVVNRVEPVIMELERVENIMIVTHQAVLRCIYAYFMNSPQSSSPWMKVPLHTLIKLTPRPYGTEEQRFPANIPAVNTWRGKGSSSVLPSK